MLQIKGKCLSLKTCSCLKMSLFKDNFDLQLSHCKLFCLVLNYLEKHPPLFPPTSYNP